MKHNSATLIFSSLLLASTLLFAQDESDDPAAETAEEVPADRESGDEPGETPADETTDPEADDGAGQSEAAETPVVPRAELTLDLMVYPTYAPEQAARVYRPLVEYLSAATPYEINLLTSRNYHSYWLEMRRGETPDLTLDEAHLTAWRMVEQGYTPLVKPAAPVTYSLLTSDAYADGDLSTFVARRVATLPSPALGYVVLVSWYTNPLQQPRILSTAQTSLNAVESIFAQEAEAAMAPNWLAERYPNLYAVRTSQEFPGNTLSIAPDLAPEVGQAITEAMLMLHDDPDHYTALNELNVERFQEADPIEYEGLDQLLSTVFAY